METRAIRCPTCHTTTTIQGTPGQRIIITCPHCKASGQFTMPHTQTAQGQPAISITHLTKRYKDTTAVQDVSFTVRQGEIFGFLGPNGAGKTTTIKAMLGLIQIDSGTITINGHNVTNDGVQARQDLRYLPERVTLFDNLTPTQTLQFFCELRGEDPSQIPGILKEVGLDQASNRKVGGFSKGMTQLLGIAQVLIGHPKICILDEPSSGLDPRWVKVIREKIRQLNDNGATIIFSSHILSEVESLCDRVAIINKGRLIAEDTIDKIQSVVQTKPRLELTVPGLNGKIPKVLNKINTIVDITVRGDVLTITCDVAARGKIIAALEREGLTISNMKTIEPSLEDAFLKLVGGGTQ